MTRPLSATLQLALAALVAGWAVVAGAPALRAQEEAAGEGLIPPTHPRERTRLVYADGGRKKEATGYFERVNLLREGRLYETADLEIRSDKFPSGHDRRFDLSKVRPVIEKLLAAKAAGDTVEFRVQEGGLAGNVIPALTGDRLVAVEFPATWLDVFDATLSGYAPDHGLDRLDALQGLRRAHASDIAAFDWELKEAVDAFFEEQYKTVVEHAPRQGRAWLALADWRRETDDFEGELAACLAADVSGLEAGAEEVHLRLGLHYLRSPFGLSRQAAAEFDKAAALPRARLLHARAVAESGDTRAAQAEFARLLRDPASGLSADETAEAAVRYGDLLRRGGRFAEAEDLYAGKFIAKDSQKAAAAQVGLAEIRAADGKWTDALKVIDSHPAVAEAKNLLGGGPRGPGENRGRRGATAEESAPKEEERGDVPRDPVAARALRVFALATASAAGGPRGVEATLEKIVRRSADYDPPSTDQALVTLGHLAETFAKPALDAQGKPAAETDLRPARDFYEQALRANGRNVWALYRLGRLYERGGNAEEASRYYTQVLAVDVNHVDALNSLGLISYAHGMAVTGAERAEALARAQRYWTKSAALAPDQPRVQNALGLLALNQFRNEKLFSGDKKRQEALLAEAERRFEAARPSGTLVALNGLAFVRYSRGESESARTFFQQVKAAGPNGDPAQVAYATRWLADIQKNESRVQWVDTFRRDGPLPPGEPLGRRWAVAAKFADPGLKAGLGKVDWNGERVDALVITGDQKEEQRVTTVHRIEAPDTFAGLSAVLVLEEYQEAEVGLFVSSVRGGKERDTDRDPATTNAVYYAVRATGGERRFLVRQAPGGKEDLLPLDPLKGTEPTSVTLFLERPADPAAKGLQCWVSGVKVGAPVPVSVLRSGAEEEYHVGVYVRSLSPGQSVRVSVPEVRVIRKAKKGKK
ncbi:MAG: tetratricopeptide repeat protein [Planctomycetes bacterium]|nr:tetratricopeptide repeat protein [Planctomycetota bacterium]